MNIIICDDDPASIEHCRDMILRCAKNRNIDVSIKGVATGERLLFEEELIAETDLIYLDEHMPGLTGLETASKLRHRGFSADIVFYTVDETRAIDAFDVEALHYVVKGRTTADRFEDILLRAERRSRRRSSEMISLSCGGAHRSIDIRDIRYFEVKAQIVTVHYNGADGPETFEFYSTLSKIEDRLRAKGFVRIHRSYLVRRACIAHKFKTDVLLTSGERLPVGRTHRLASA